MIGITAFRRIFSDVTTKRTMCYCQPLLCRVKTVTEQGKK